MTSTVAHYMCATHFWIFSHNKEFFFFLRTLVICNLNSQDFKCSIKGPSYCFQPCLDAEYLHRWQWFGEWKHSWIAGKLKPLPYVKLLPVLT